MNKIGFCLASADFVGGDGQDDILGYDLSRNFVCSFDADNLSSSPAFDGDPVGAFSISFLKFPEEGMSINNIQQRPSSEGLGDQYTEEWIWENFFTPGFFVDTSTIIPGEYNQFISTSYFSLQPGETKEIIYAVSFTNGPVEDPNHSIRRNGLTGQYYAGLAALKGNFIFNAYEVELISPSNGQTYSDIVNVNWSTNGAQNRLADFIYYSSDNGDHWNFIVVDSSLTGSYNWDTQNVPDGDSNKILIVSVSENGTAEGISEGTFIINNSTYVYNDELQPLEFNLFQNFPNPFNPSTTIRFSIPEAGFVNLSIYNLLGEKVCEVLNQELVTGSYEYNYDASSLSSGIYFYTIKTANFTSTKKMLLLK